MIRVFLSSLQTSVDVPRDILSCAKCRQLLPDTYTSYECRHSICDQCVADPTCARCKVALKAVDPDPTVSDALRSCPRVTPCGQILQSYQAFTKHVLGCVKCTRAGMTQAVTRANAVAEAQKRKIDELVVTHAATEKKLRLELVESRIQLHSRCNFPRQKCKDMYNSLTRGWEKVHQELKNKYDKLAAAQNVKDDMSKLRNKIRDLEHQLSLKNYDCSTLEAKHSNTLKELKGYRVKIYDMNKQLPAAQKALAEANKRIRTLEDEVRVVNAKYQVVFGQAHAAKKEIASLQRNIESQAEDMETVESNFTKNFKELKREARRNEDLCEKNEGLTACVEELTTKNEGLTAESEELITQLRASVEQVSQTRLQLEKTQLAHKLSLARKMKAEIENLP